MERTIQELGAALVAARNRDANRLKSQESDGDHDSTVPNDVSALRARIEALEADLEIANAHLKLERERVRMFVR